MSRTLILLGFALAVNSRRRHTTTTFGPNLQSAVMAVSAPRLSRDGTAYAYVYVQDVPQAYVMRGLK